METDQHRTTRRAGLAAAAAGVLLPGSVAAELVVGAQRPDGTVVRPLLFTVYLGIWFAGAALLVAALLGIRALHRSAPAHRGTPPRGWRVGTALASAGAALLGLFAVVMMVTALADGAPFEAAFLLFALGFLLLIVGQTMAGLAARRTGVLGRAWPLVVVSAAGALLALAAPADPFHDIGLVVFGAGWLAAGAVLASTGRPARPTHRPAGQASR